jgi:hypothetical protein
MRTGFPEIIFRKRHRIIAYRSRFAGTGVIAILGTLFSAI